MAKILGVYPFPIKLARGIRLLTEKFGVNLNVDEIIKSDYLPALLRRKQAGMCHSEPQDTMTV